MKLLPLNRQHNRDLFDCGEENLNTFFRCYASQCVRNRDCSCYVLTDDPLDQIPLGYFTLSSFCISRTLLSAMKIRSGYTQIPVTLLGRLAVDIKIQGKRVGHYLLNSASSWLKNHLLHRMVFMFNLKIAEPPNFIVRLDS